MAKNKKSIWVIVAGFVGLLAVVGATFGIVTAVKQSKCEHVWNDGEVKVEATCAKEGKIMFKCDDCGKIEIEKIEKLPHVWADEELKLPTCAENGHTEYTYCENCDAYKNGVEPQVLLALGHTEEVIEGRAATCTEAGITIGKYCTTCNEMTVEQRVIAAKGHNVVQVAAKAATCSEPGHTSGQKCSNCDLVYSGIEEIPEKGHKDDNGDGYCDTCRTRLSPTMSMQEVALETGMEYLKDRYLRVYKPTDAEYKSMLVMGDDFVGQIFIFSDGVYANEEKTEKYVGIVVYETKDSVDFYFPVGGAAQKVRISDNKTLANYVIPENFQLDESPDWVEGVYFLEEK